jgi:hypothetical protein
MNMRLANNCAQNCAKPGREQILLCALRLLVAAQGPALQRLSSTPEASNSRTYARRLKTLLGTKYLELRDTPRVLFPTALRTASIPGSARFNIELQRGERVLYPMT